MSGSRVEARIPPAPAARHFNATLLFYPAGNPRLRLFALWYFTTLMILWNVLGHTVLGFEQSWASPPTAIATAVGVSMLLDGVDARARGRALRFTGSAGAFLNFLPACLIPGFACSMLLYTNERLWPLVFAVVVSIGSKLVFRAPVGGGHTQHVFNPSNLGVGLTLVLLPEVSFAPPYHFTENVTGLWNLGVPILVLLSGIVVHALFTGRLPLVAAWVGGFVLQGLARAWLAGTPLLVPLMPMTSAAFIIFTLYMVPDPATTPLDPRRQAAFGFCVALVYGVLQRLHLVFGLFYALLIVCAARGLALHALALHRRLRDDRSAAGGSEPAPARSGRRRGNNRPPR
ncbi:MAG TPA: enediyne biosynthesis protein UnbU [Candidatus Polarisedimenticolia bacterium]|jgi:Na+-translocating ferredoxin:NAD+ oxidoreductase RnfD subunit|nr:enediyne biosynthesis protein UnbU [Candidatus Polarisedimenticolia bacterium]